MSRTFAGIPIQQLKQAAYTLPVQLGRAALADPTVVPITVAWGNYNNNGIAANAGITINLDNIGNSNKLNRILSVYIDNTNCDVPVYVQFPDTLYTVSCPPNADLWQPVITGLKQANIFGEGFTAGGTQPSTRVSFLNINQNPFANYEFPATESLWLASNVIGRSSLFGGNYGPPSLGDQFGEWSIALTDRTQLPIFGTPWPAPIKFLYLKAFSVDVTDASNSISTVLDFQIFAQRTLQQFWQRDVVIDPTPPPGVIPVFSITGCNIRLDATDTFQFLNGGNVITNGKARISACFTTNPN